MGYAYRYDTKLGTFTIAESGKGITDIDLSTSLDGLPKDCEEKETPLLAQAAKQLREYFDGARTEFDLPLDPVGTEFQKRVWEQLRRIPYGETRTYRQIAEAADCPKGYRAVGLANNRNRIIIAVPCHRVIGSDGSMTGFGGGIDIKEELLRFENSGGTCEIKRLRD